MGAHVVDLQQNPNLPYDHPYICITIININFVIFNYFDIICYSLLISFRFSFLSLATIIAYTSSILQRTPRIRFLIFVLKEKMIDDLESWIMFIILIIHCDCTVYQLE